MINATNRNTVEYNGTNQTIAFPNGSTTGYHILILSGSGTKTMPAYALNIYSDLTLSGTATVVAAQDIVVAGNITIGSGTTLTSASYTVSVGGNWNNGGTDSWYWYLLRLMALWRKHLQAIHL
ncbi:MAG: hypothetical protein IPP73_17595 [Chitinophagaceae bacterium]|nr:hypothetical protein [Chitinophagaceae bacterium]